MADFKRINRTQCKFNQELFLIYLKNKYNLENNYITLIESMIDYFKKENSNTLYMVDYEYIAEQNEVHYYYIYKYINELFYILNNANIEIDIKILTKNFIITFD